MSARVARLAATSIWVAIVVLAVVEVWMIAVTVDRAFEGWGFRGFEAVLSLSFGSVSALIATRRPDNRIGWLLLGTSLIAAVQGIVDQYPVLAEAGDPDLPFAERARWLAAWIWVIPSVVLVSLLPLIFPDGRLLSRRWRAAVLLAVVAVAVQIGSIILATRPFGPLPPTTNITPYFEQLGPRMALGYGLYLAAAAVAAGSLVVRYRRAGGVERQQIKWVAYAAVVGALGAALGLTPIFLGQVFFIATALLASAAIGIAILRYRLYDIDLIINRTIVYGALSAILAGVYTASITLSQRLFMAVTGERSDAAIVLTTLIVASTFTPLKARVQGGVDRRLKAAAIAQSTSGGMPHDTAEPGLPAGLDELIERAVDRALAARGLRERGA